MLVTAVNKVNVASTPTNTKSVCACTILCTGVYCRHACLQSERACLHHIIYQHVSQARVPALRACVPAQYYLPTCITGTRACNQSVCACTILFTAIDKVNVASTPTNTYSVCACTILFTDVYCTHVCLQSERVCHRHFICQHVLHANVPANSAVGLHHILHPHG